MAKKDKKDKKTEKKSAKKAKLAPAKKPGKSALDRVRAALLKIDLEEIAPPPIPVESLIAEAKLLARVAGKRLAALKKVGLDAKLVTSLDERAEALSDAQAELTQARGTQRTKEEIGVEREAIALRSQMVADGRYALRDDDDAQKVIDAIQEGEGLDDLVQDLRELAAFATTHKAPLAKVGVKAKANGDRATKLAAHLEELLAARRGGNDAGEAPRALRDRAATYLAHAMREVRAAGTYAFRSDPQAQQAFRSAYAAANRRLLASRAAKKASGDKGTNAPAGDAGAEAGTPDAG